MIVGLALLSLAQSPFPFPQDCSRFNASSKVPDWFSDCDEAAGNCFSIQAPSETQYNVGNTTYGESSAGGVQWCIDHLQGYIYNKVVDPAGAMYYEVDDIQSKPPAPNAASWSVLTSLPMAQSCTGRARTSRLVSRARSPIRAPWLRVSSCTISRSSQPQWSREFPTSSPIHIASLVGLVGGMDLARGIIQGCGASCMAQQSPGSSTRRVCVVSATPKILALHSMRWNWLRSGSDLGRAIGRRAQSL